MDRNFIAVEFAVVFENLRIRHNEGMPYWPHSNGEVGYFKFNGTLMKVITIAEAGLKTFKEELKKFFFSSRPTERILVQSREYTQWRC